MKMIFKKESYLLPTTINEEHENHPGTIEKDEFENSKDYVIKKHINLLRKLGK